MTAGKSPKTIATINFKGGVGKTTATWCLGDVISSFSNSKVLLFDLDAQMSLTQAIALNEDGNLEPKFQKWYEDAADKNKTIFHALEEFTAPKREGRFDFPVGPDFVYPLTKGLHFVPSVEDLYWMELGVFDRDKAKEFIRRLLAKISATNKLPNYDYVLFDCPPSFTVLSYSVLACCDLILIPVNPDFFASKGTNLILNSLKMQIEPFPLPQIAVFMNKAKTNSRHALTKETALYMEEVGNVCRAAASAQDIRVDFLHSHIWERVDIKRAITRGNVPPAFVEQFKQLWNEIVRVLR